MTIPENADFSVDAHSMSGTIINSFNLKLKNEMINSSLTGVVGKGGKHVNINTVSGDINISK